MMSKSVHAFISLLLLSSGDASPVGGNSACKTPGTVFEGDSATVECYFHRPHEKFMVYRLLSSSEKKQEILMVCTHTESEPDCNNPDGLKVTVTPNKDRATIHIASAQQKNSGKYFCKTLPASDDHADNCTLTVQSNTLRPGSLVTCEAHAPVSLGQKSSLACEFSKNAGNTGICLVKQLDSESAEEEIFACKGNGQCESKKAGYTIVENTETRVTVEIPEVMAEHTGRYTCKSTTLKGITHSCQLQADLERRQAEDVESPWAYAAYGALAVVLTVGLVGAALFLKYRRQIRDARRADYISVRVQEREGERERQEEGKVNRIVVQETKCHIPPPQQIRTHEHFYV